MTALVTTGTAVPSWTGGIPDRRAPVAVAASPTMAPRWVRIDPHLYGRVSPATLAALGSRGCHVTRVGRVALVRAPRGDRWVVEVAEPGAADTPITARIDAHHRWLRRRGGAPLPRQAAAERAHLALFLSSHPSTPWWRPDLWGRVPRDPEPVQ